MITEFSHEEHQKQQIDEAHAAAILSDFRRDGFVVLKDVFPKNYIQALCQSFLRDYQQCFIDPAHQNSVEVSARRLQISVEVNGVFNSSQLYANPFVYSIIDRLLYNEFIISDLTCVTSLPGAKKMGAHTDGRIFDNHPIANLLPPHAVGVLVPLIPFTPLNGPTRIWPGSQCMPARFDEKLDTLRFIDLVIDTGSCIVMDHRIIHAGNPNLSDQIRPLLYINYSTSWYYDPHNFKKQAPLRVNDANFDQIPDQYKGLFVRRHVSASRAEAAAVTHS